MTEMLSVREGEHGLYRFFAVDLPQEKMLEFTTSATGANIPLQEALGLSALDPHHVQTLDLKELRTVGIDTYLSEGLALPQSEIDRALPLLEDRNGPVVVIASAAFTPPEIIVPQAPVSPLIVLQEDQYRKPLMELRADSAQGQLGVQDAPSQHRTPMPFWAKVLLALGSIAVISAALTSGDKP